MEKHQPYFRPLQTRKAASDLADLRSAVRSNVFQSTAAVLTAVDAPLANKLTSALREANAAVAALDALQQGREVVITSRVEALQAKEGEIAAAREALKVEMASKKALADAEFLSAVRPLAARTAQAASPERAALSGSPAAAAESSQSAGQDAVPVASEAAATASGQSAAASAETDDSLL